MEVNGNEVVAVVITIVRSVEGEAVTLLPDSRGEGGDAT